MKSSVSPSASGCGIDKTSGMARLLHHWFVNLTARVGDILPTLTDFHEVSRAVIRPHRWSAPPLRNRVSASELIASALRSSSKPR
jgi:hypothetical protein